MDRSATLYKSYSVVTILCMVTESSLFRLFVHLHQVWRNFVLVSRVSICVHGSRARGQKKAGIQSGYIVSPDMRTTRICSYHPDRSNSIKLKHRKRRNFPSHFSGRQELQAQDAHFRAPRLSDSGSHLDDDGVAIY